MKSAKWTSSVTHTVTWLTAVIKLIPKETSASCPSKCSTQTLSSPTRDQLLMSSATSTRTTACSSWESKGNGHLSCLTLITFAHLMQEQVFAFQTGVKDPILYLLDNLSCPNLLKTQCFQSWWNNLLAPASHYSLCSWQEGRKLTVKRTKIGNKILATGP